LLNTLMGAFWYGPLWGELYQKAVHMSSADLEKIKAKGISHLFLLEFLGNMLFVTFYKALIVHFRLVNLEQIIGIGVAIWLGFIVPAQMSPIIWEGKNKTLLFIAAGHKLVSILLVGHIFCFI